VPKLARIPTRHFFTAAGVLAVAALAFILFVPSGFYLYTPNQAEPLAGRVQVQGERQTALPGAILYVDINVRPASWFERLLPFVRPDGSTMLPKDEVVPPGSTVAERREDARAEMTRSERIAAAVALREAGYSVRASARGALVEGVASDAPAAGTLREQDVIVAVDGRVVRTPSDLRRLVGMRLPGEAVRLRLRRDGKVREASVRTIADPRNERRPLIGIRVAQAADIKLPLKVNIDLGDVGGPSAGLAFALDILEELGENVDRGYRVAATGEIELDGAVEAVGGIKQKVFGVRNAEADVFLVPAGDNADEARRYAGNLRVIPVETFQQALRELKTLPPKG
jgi:PDZ domain-containing protein